MNKNLILVLIFLLGISLIIFELIVPIYGKITALNQEIQKKQKDLSEAKIIAEKISVLTEKYNAMPEKIAQIDNLVPVKESLPEIITTLDVLASENGAALESISFQSKKAASESLAKIETPLIYNSLGVQISSRIGNYAGFKNFLKAIENNLRLIDAETIILSESAEQTGGLKLSANLIVYYK